MRALPNRQPAWPSVRKTQYAVTPAIASQLTVFCELPGDHPDGGLAGRLAGASGVLDGRGGARDVVPVVGGEQRRHVRRAVGQVAVVVVGGQPLHVAVRRSAAVRRGRAGAGVPGADAAAALVEELVADDERLLDVVVERRRRRSRATRSQAACRMGAAEQWVWRPQGPVPASQRGQSWFCGVSGVLSACLPQSVSRTPAQSVRSGRRCAPRSRCVPCRRRWGRRPARAVVEEAVAHARGLQAVDRRDVRVGLGRVRQHAGASLSSMPWPHSWSKTAAISPVLRQPPPER